MRGLSWVPGRDETGDAHIGLARERLRPAAGLQSGPGPDPRALAGGARRAGGMPGLGYHVAMAAWEPLDEFRYHHRLREVGGTALVLFGSPGCGACRVAERRLPGAAPPGVGLFKVDVQLSPALARAHDIFHLPELLLYRDGHFHARLTCEIDAASLARAIDRALSSPPQEEP
ncbi:MAG TPA: thioredoxin family protein [Thiobacillaceae bacterium]|nr:thioredoxin family protein [Thiobacillaceae bacterium]